MGGPERSAAELMAADRRFAAAVATARGEDRADVWADWFAPDGRQILPGSVVVGRRDIRDLMAPAFAEEGYSLEWEPDQAEADAGGAMGWTSGRYLSRRPGPDGPRESRGRYLTLWRRLPDGSWRVSVDTGVPD